MRVITDCIIVVMAWFTGVILFIKIVVTLIGLLVILYRLREQVIESGGMKNYIKKLLKWSE